MLKLLTCVHGHFWEAVVGDGAPGPPPPCPECGAPADGGGTKNLIPET